MRLWLTALVALCLAGGAAAQDPAAFYKGRTVELYVGYSPGGGYDLYGRTVARFMGRHLPGGPTIVVKNMPGAGSLRLANWLYNVAPKDGAAFGIVGRGVPMEPVLGGQGAQFDGRRFTWIGSANDEVSTCVAAKESGIGRFEDLKTRQLIVGGTGSGADTDVFPAVLNHVFGTKMKIVSGYPGGSEVALAMERGEVGGRCGWSWSTIKANSLHLVRDGRIRLLVQFGLSKHADLPDVPLVMDLAENDEQRQVLRVIFARQVMGRPFLAPPGVPAERAAALRAAFMATMKDPEFLAVAEKAQLEITPVAGEAVAALMEEVYATPPAIAEKAAAAVR
ncbi:MAG: Bug family tripartite tricarboxylate transporter substrate binding protein [Rhodospirillales bacterium]